MAAISVFGLLNLDNAGAVPPRSAAVEVLGYAQNIVRNTGTISGNIVLGPGANRIENGGTIRGNMKFDAGDDRLTVLPGSNITGIVDGGDGIGLLTLAGTGSGSFASATNLPKLIVSLASWTLTGAANYAEGIGVSQGASLAGPAANLGNNGIANDGAISVARKRCDHFTALATLTPNNSAVSRAECPPTTDAATCPRRSSAYALAIPAGLQTGPAD